MSYRRLVERPQPASAPPDEQLGQVVRVPVGCCPKCGQYLGRGALVRAHAKDCEGAGEMWHPK